ncbi:uncharacterized protein LOC114793344 isoform X2 [Denticeps clupeoides]|uniref:uncharacterized protein LOC114793344 isoform X2 n=1 Tax=Denticeps clupeoides TaxID=299321 RepID=UPI0010A47F92|nr:Purkinje cell protein 2 homolog isoform X2 [Denticeps clupeoides]
MELAMEEREVLKSNAYEQQDAAEDQLLNIMSHSQRGRMEEQRCSLEPRRGSASNPGLPDKSPNSDTDQFFRMVANSQSRRLDDQRVSLSVLPGLQGSRLAESRGSAPHVTVTPGSPASDSLSRNHRSASCYTLSDSGRQSQHEFSQSEQDQFLKIMSHSQRGRMEEQRCYLSPSQMSLLTANLPEPGNKAPSFSLQDLPARQACHMPAGDQDPEQFFKMVTNSQSRRLDDQRTFLPYLPGIQGSSSSKNHDEIKSSTGEEVEKLCKVVSRVQGSRMEEQRCNAPDIMMKLASPGPPRKSQSRPASPSSHSLQDISACEKDQFLTIMKHSQRGRMEEQRCSLEPIKKSHTVSSDQDAEQFFRLDDDQRATLQLPVLQGPRPLPGGPAPDQPFPPRSVPNLTAILSLPRGLHPSAHCRTRNECRR